MNSLLGKEWKIREESIDLPLLERISKHRQVDPDNEMEELHSPWLLKDIDIAVSRIEAAIDNKERIMIHGDYDVDGISGASILYLALKELGGNVSVRLPHRDKNGYGLHNDFYDECVKGKVKLVITTDCGISNVSEVEYGNTLGIETIITDHHSIPAQLPNAIAIINPKQEDCDYPEKMIVGAVVAWKLITALGEHLHRPSAAADRYIDLAALATVTDCAPLIGENRLIVKKGLLQFGNSQHRGLKALVRSNNLESAELRSYHLGFVIGPCINAAGRIEDPMMALQAMIGDESKAAELVEINRQRQDIMRTALEEALQIVEKDLKDDPIIILWGEDWQPGIIGLIAGRICEKYNRPSICLTKKDDKYVGSCRSIPQVNIVEVMRKHEDLFIAYGGHAQAAGLSISADKLKEMKERLKTELAAEFAANPLSPYISVDSEVLLDEISLKTVAEINRLEPFGIGNPKPKLILRNMTVSRSNIVGSDQKHLQLHLRHGERFIKGIAFNMAEYEEKLRSWEKIDIVCQLSRNEFRNNVSVDLQIIDARPSSN